MFQREVAERIVAAPGGKTYGRLAVLAQWRTRPKLLFDVPARAFTPAAEGDLGGGAAGAADRRRAVPVGAVEAVTAAAFGQRRKMLRSSLKSLWPDPEAVLAQRRDRADAPRRAGSGRRLSARWRGASRGASASRPPGRPLSASREQPVDEGGKPGDPLAPQPLGRQDGARPREASRSRSSLTMT